MCHRNDRNLSMLGAVLAVSIGCVLAGSVQAEDESDIQSRGPLIRWQESSGEMLQPSAEQTAVLVEAFRQQMKARFGDGQGVLAASANMAPEQLENGMVRMRLPVELLNFAIVGKPAQEQALDVLPEK